MIRPLLVVLSLAAAAVPESIGLRSVGETPASLRRCSLVPGFHTSTAAMLATPTSDTLVAGPGSIRQGEGWGHSGNGLRSAIYGQRFRAVRLHAQGGGAGDSAQNVVLVPWDYDASCAPVPWARSARWSKGTDTLLYAARLRTRSEWVGDFPTFDVTYPETAVYDGSPQPDMFGEMDSTSRWNTPSEYFELLRRTPSTARLLADESRALEDLVTWATANPAAMTKRPAKGQLEGLRRAIRQNRLLRSEVRFRGTYELTVHLRSGRSFRRYLKTADVPFDATDIGPVADGPNGIKLEFNMAAVEGALPREISRDYGSWGFEVISTGSHADREFPVRMELAEFKNMTKHIPELDSLAREWAATSYPAPRGGFTVGTNGSARLRLAWDTNGDGREDFVVEGRRISMATAKDWVYWRDR